MYPTNIILDIDKNVIIFIELFTKISRVGHWYSGNRTAYILPVV